MKLVGFKHVCFTAKDTGALIDGYNFYLTEERQDVEGVYAERIFVSKAKLAGYVPHVGDEIEIVYNRFGKVARVMMA